MGLEGNLKGVWTRAPLTPGPGERVEGSGTAECPQGQTRFRPAPLSQVALRVSQEAEKAQGNWEPQELQGGRGEARI